MFISARLTTVLAGIVVATAATFAAAESASAQTIVTIQQISNNRYVDAHEHAGEDYRVVTRPAQNNDTQHWIMTQVAGADLHVPTSQQRPLPGCA